MKRRYLLFVIAAAVSLVLVAACVVFLLPRTHVAVSNPPLRVAIVVVTTFLMFTLARYFALLWLAYLHHVESKTAVDRDDQFEPLVTILVPAYNEETVIEASIRSLLELDYPAYDVLVIDDGSTDDTLRRIATSAHGTVVSLPVNLRIGGAMQAGYRYAVERIAQWTRP